VLQRRAAPGANKGSPLAGTFKAEADGDDAAKTTESPMASTSKFGKFTPCSVTREGSYGRVCFVQAP
jgi:hypothetical protein